MLSRTVPPRQDGVVLLMVIVVLVALTLGALALTRSVYTSNVIAGNLAFQRAATHSAELGIETALKWLEDNKAKEDAQCASGAMLLYCDQAAGAGYIAHRQADNLAHPNWRVYWDKSLATQAKTVTSRDAAGNTVSYVIQRMCATAGDPQDGGNTCSKSPKPSASECGSSSCTGKENLKLPPLVYYRITVNVEGPRNTRSLVQALVSL